jgi:DNA polymerase elongation subunit (family B)
MVDLGIHGCQWITARVSDVHRTHVPSYSRISRCQLEFIVHCSDLTVVPIDDGPGGDPPKLRVLYIDIECPAEPDEQGARFPTAKRDAITHISAVMGDLGEPNPIVSSVLALVPRPGAHVAHLIHTHVIEFAQESVLIDSWHALVNAWDPDVIATYNGEGFDFPYIIDRGYQVGCKEHTDFSRRKCSSVG